MNLGKAIKTVRVKNGFTQTDFAANCEMSQTYCSQVEKNHKQPSLPMLKKMSYELGMPLPLLLYISLEESDIAKNKREAFKIIAPAINGMIKELFGIEI